MYAQRVSRTAEALDIPEGKDGGYTKGSTVMAKVQEVHKNFERMVLRVAGDDMLRYHELMRGTTKDLGSASVAYVERLVALQKQSRRHGR